MKFLIISGAPDTGKTTSINKIALWLTGGVITSDINGNALPTFLPDASGKYWDFSIVIILKGKKIIIHSATDDKYNIDQLVEKIKDNPDTNVVISSCRDLYWQRDYILDYIKSIGAFLLESPLAKITRRNDAASADVWYKGCLLTLHQHLLLNIPFNL